MFKDIITILQGERARKAPISTLIEVLHMRFGSQRLPFHEYLAYRFHELDDLSAEERSRFLGSGRKFRLNNVCNDSHWFMLGEKLPMTLFMMATNIPMPKIHAVYDISGRNLPGAVTLRDKSDVITYLRSTQHYPLFVKPSYSSYGWGAAGLKTYKSESDNLQFLDDKERNLSEWVDQLNPNTAHGILFQELLRPHPEIARVCGPRVSSIRVSTARLDGHVSIVSAVWRIPTGNNMIDNFQHGASGNLLGGVDIATGQINRVVGRANNKVESVGKHPDTDEHFDKYVLPDWPKVVDVCSQAASYLMGMNLHHWDIALTEQGPVIVENNEIGDIDLHQHGNRKGFWSDTVEKTRCQSYPRYWQSMSLPQKISVAIMRSIDTFC